MILIKTDAVTSFWHPLEQGRITVKSPLAARLSITDAWRREYLNRPVRLGSEISFAARGAVGRHAVALWNAAGEMISSLTFTLRAKTRLSCNRGPYAQLAERIGMLMQLDQIQPMIINGRQYHMFVCWGRDHVHTLKAQKFFQQDVKSGLEYWLETQEDNGMFWDTISPNDHRPAPSWLGEALGEGYYRYDDHMKYIVRRIPVEADCEFLYTEGVWQVWKATGDDAWMARQLPRLEKALRYNNSHPTRWSKKHGLVRRSMCMDSWDFVNPLFCHGDHRCIHSGDPQFLFHGDNSGLYSSYWRMAEMFAAVGNVRRAEELRAEGEALRERANAKLFFETSYGHMIPEDLPEEEFYAQVGDERKRLSLSTGYTINRRMPTHAMALKIIREYQRRRHEKQHESFAEWWTMDPPYEGTQWPADGHQGCPRGEYMNGAICAIIAGEISRAAFEHGCETYGADILERVWDLSERDGGELFQVYRRLPESREWPRANFQFVDLRNVANRGLKNGAHPGLTAWTGEGDNDMRNLPTGRQTFGAIPFEIIAPDTNGGRAILYVGPSSSVAIPIPSLRGKSVYFLHALPGPASRDEVVGMYDVEYVDSVVKRIYLRHGHEIGLWWGVADAPAMFSAGHDLGGRDPVDRKTTRVAWRGPNPTWKNVGLYMFGWDNPRPDVAIASIRATATAYHDQKAGILMGGISFSDQPVKFEERIRSYGLPNGWSQAAVFYAVAEGLAGIEDTGRAFDRVRIAPRWVAGQASEAEVVLHYPASDGYCAYRYHHNGRDKITLDLTGSFNHADVHCLLPIGKIARRVSVGEAPTPFANVIIEKSNYADFALETMPLQPVIIEYSSVSPLCPKSHAK